jgi:hypothetical protein
MLSILLAVMIAGGCSRTQTPTPQPVAAHYHALRDSLSAEPPGVASHRLAEFLRRHAAYTITDTVQSEIDRLQASAADEYHEARELARQGDFEQAEILLWDLAAYLADTPAGAGARDYLEFDFPFNKAQWLLTRQRFDESEAVARELLTRDLTPTQSNQVETILDNLGYVDAATSLVERQDARNACRHLSVMLVQQFVEEGRYPSRFSIADVKSWGAHESEFILRGLSAIEDFEATEQGFSFVGVSIHGTHRIRVTDGRLQNDVN